MTRITFAEPAAAKSGTWVFGVVEGGGLSPAAADLDKASGGTLKRAMKQGRFRGRAGSFAELLVPAGTKLDRVLLFGLGAAKKFDARAAQAAGGRILARLNQAGATSATVTVGAVAGMPLAAAEIAASLGYGALLRSYRFDRYRTKEPRDKKPTLRSLAVQVAGATRARRLYGPLAAVAGGVFLTRDLVSEPANILYPESLARQATTLRRLGVSVEVLDEKAMKKLGMGALLGVAQGSVRQPRLVVMQWKGGGRGKADRPVAIVGKGVTFDTGGISIKPAGGMEDMKWDMGGAGVTIGLMKALAGRKAAVNVVGVVGLVENMPSGSAQRPGDIVTSMSGQTIEVLNTDAEGRLVLADALWYCQDRFNPKVMVDLATLTGAIIVGLGSQYAGLFSNNDRLAGKLASAGGAVGEKIWRLPLGKAYDRLIDCDVADMKNIGGREAGSITAAQFLQRFVNRTPWAHLDIAGVTWSKKDAPTVPRGGTGFGVRLLDRYIADNHEKR